MADTATPVAPVAIPDPAVALGQEQADIKASDAAQADLQKQREAALAPQEQGVQQSADELTKKLNEPIPKFTPPVDTARHMNPKEMSDAASIFMTLGALGGLFMRQPMTAALGAMTASMQGVMDKDQQQFDEASKKFKESFDQAMKVHEQVVKERQDIINDKKMDLTTKMNMLDLNANKWGMKAAALTTSLNQKLEFDKALVQSGEKAIEHRDTVQARMDTLKMHYAQMAQNERHFQQSQGGAGAEQLTPAGMKAAAELTKAGMPLPGGWSKAGMSRGNAILNALGAEESGGAGSGTIVADRAQFAANKTALTAITKDIAMIKPYQEMLDTNGKILKDLAAKIIKTDAPLENKTVNWLQTHAADNPDVREFLFQMNIWQTETARIVTNPRIVGQLTDNARKELQEVTSGNMSLDSTVRVVDRAQVDANNRVSKLEEEQTRIMSQIKGGGQQKQASAAAIEYLKAHPELADQFKAKYGYLPQ